MSESRPAKKAGFPPFKDDMEDVEIDLFDRTYVDCLHEAAEKFKGYCQGSAKFPHYNPIHVAAMEMIMLGTDQLSRELLRDTLKYGG